VSFLHLSNVDDELSREEMGLVWSGICDPDEGLELEKPQLRKYDALKVYDTLPRNNANWGVLPFTNWPDIVPQDDEDDSVIPSSEYFELGLCVVIKNEVFYLEEWLRWHLHIGIDKIIIENHYSVDNLEELIFDMNAEIEQNEKDRVSQGWPPRKTEKKIILVKWEQVGDLYHKNAMKDCWTRFQKVYPRVRWVGMWDADEFLVLNHPQDDLRAYLQWIMTTYPTTSCVNFRWKQFTSGGHFHTPSERTQVRAYLHGCRNANYSLYSKPMCKPEEIEELYFHGHWIEKFKNPANAVVMDATARHGHWMFHYMSRSFENYFMKTSRKHGIFRTLFPWQWVSEQEANCDGTDTTLLYDRFFLRDMESKQLKEMFDEWVPAIPMTDTFFLELIPEEDREVARQMWNFS